MLKIIAQIIGVIASAFIIYSFQSRKNKHLFLIQMIGALLFSFHFGLLGAFTGFSQDVLAVGRNYLLFSNKKWAKSPIFLWLLIILYVVTGYFTYSGILSILPPLAMIVGTIVMWSKDGKKIRIAQLLCISPCWLTYNISVFSISGIVTECFVLISVLISFIRYGFNGFDNKSEPEVQQI